MFIKTSLAIAFTSVVTASTSLAQINADPTPASSSTAPTVTKDTSTDQTDAKHSNDTKPAETELEKAHKAHAAHIEAGNHHAKLVVKHQVLHKQAIHDHLQTGDHDPVDHHAEKVAHHKEKLEEHNKKAQDLAKKAIANAKKSGDSKTADMIAKHHNKETRKTDHKAIYLTKLAKKHNLKGVNHHFDLYKHHTAQVAKISKQRPQTKEGKAKLQEHRDLQKIHANKYNAAAHINHARKKRHLQNHKDKIFHQNTAIKQLENLEPLKTKDLTDDSVIHKKADKKFNQKITHKTSGSTVNQNITHVKHVNQTNTDHSTETHHAEKNVSTDQNTGTDHSSHNSKNSGDSHGKSAHEHEGNTSAHTAEHHGEHKDAKTHTHVEKHHHEEHHHTEVHHHYHGEKAHTEERHEERHEMAHKMEEENALHAKHSAEWEKMPKEFKALVESVVLDQRKEIAKARATLKKSAEDYRSAVVGTAKCLRDMKCVEKHFNKHSKEGAICMKDKQCHEAITYMTEQTWIRRNIFKCMMEKKDCAIDI